MRAPRLAPQVRPGCWQQVNASKAILPRLWALLRHGCHGSATASYPALLPLLALMPAEVVGPSTNLLEHLLGSVWTGLKACSTRCREPKAAPPACCTRPAWACLQPCWGSCLVEALHPLPQLVQC